MDMAAELTMDRISGNERVKVVGAQTELYAVENVRVVLHDENLLRTHAFTNLRFRASPDPKAWGGAAFAVPPRGRTEDVSP